MSYSYDYDGDDDDDVTFFFPRQRDLLQSKLTYHSRASFLDSDLDFAYSLQEALDASLSIYGAASELQASNPSRGEGTSCSQERIAFGRVHESPSGEGSSNFKERTARVVQAPNGEGSSRKARVLQAPNGEGGSRTARVVRGRSIGEGSSSRGAGKDNTRTFRMYVKGLVSEVGSEVLCGIGVAICDEKDEIVGQLNKALFGNGKSKTAAEIKALIEGLNMAMNLQIKRLVVYVDYYPVYHFITKRWPPKQRKIALLINQAFLHQRKFTNCNTKFVARSDVKHAFRLAKDAIVSQITKPVESSHRKKIIKNCVICLEDTDVEQMFPVDGCQHQYCFSCMKQHVEVKLLHGILPKCPHDGCKSDLHVESCGKFLTAKLIETWSERIREASIPVAEKVYCPHPKCSTLMSRTEINEYAKDAFVGAEHSGARKCVKCHGLFCIHCKVPWHRNLTCGDYKMLHPNPPTEDVKLKSLASMNLWRQCAKCNHMIELVDSCFHMTCRCGYEFCYNCGLEWKNKTPTCRCPLWDEDNILHEDDDGDFDDDEEDEDDEYDFFLSDSDDFYLLIYFLLKHKYMVGCFMLLFFSLFL